MPLKIGMRQRTPWTGSLELLDLFYTDVQHQPNLKSQDSYRFDSSSAWMVKNVRECALDIEDT